MCLGVRLSENGRMESKLERRIGRRATVVGSLRRTVLEWTICRKETQREAQKKMEG